MFHPACNRIFAAALAAVAVLALPCALHAGGPKYVAGSSYFNASAMGEPLHWAGGQVKYFVDQGDLSATVTNRQAVAMVDAAAALWSAVPTAGVTLTDTGSLAEDVNGSNVTAAAASGVTAGTGSGNPVFAAPADVAPSATGFPVAVIFDADGSVLNTLLGAYASDASSCNSNAVTVWMDNIHADATVAHAVMIVNGRCTATDDQQEMMSYALERAWGQILGLGASQIYPHAADEGNNDQMQAWPVMQPMMGDCAPSGGICIPNPGALKPDDIAELNRIYPITAANLASFPGKEITAANTVSIQGSISFLAGAGMQGVNVVAVPLDASGNPLYEYTVSAVSGASFSGNHGSAVTGATDANGVPYSQWGSDDPAQQGAFDLRYIPLPPGMTSVTYQLTFEPIDPLYVLENTVGPYMLGSPTPSGTLNPITVSNLAAGAAQTVTVHGTDSAVGGYGDAISTEASPRLLPASGLWSGRLSQIGQADWFNFPVRGNRLFTVVTQAVDEQGAPSGTKAMPALGIWDAFDPVGATAVGIAAGLNGAATGESWLQVTTSMDDVVRLGIADMRGDGRPDYAYNGWVLYADTVEPSHLPASGGPIVIRGTGFHPSDTVTVDGVAAQVTGISPNEITAIAPPAGMGVTGSVDVEVDDLPIYNAATVIHGGISYDAGAGDSLTLVTAPQNTVPIGVPLSFSVTALEANLQPAGGVTVTYTVTSGAATLGCGQPACAVTAAGDGSATMTVTATGNMPAVVTAALSNGAQLQAHFTGGTPPTLAALTPNLSLAAGATVAWPTQAIVLNNGAPVSGQAVAWQAAGGIASAATAAVTTGASGIATNTLNVGPLAEGQQVSSNACLNGTSQCVAFTALGARPEYATVEAVSGTAQSLAVSATPAQIVLRVRDMDGNPMAGATVTLYQAIYAWAPPCPPQGRCAQAELLATQTSAAVSGLDGTVRFAPAGIPGVATNILGLAATGDTSTAKIAIEMHP